MTTTIKRLIIFGDSMSDIGVKRKTWTGAFASLLGLMRTNQANRYSDNRNWTDFIWEWAGGSPLIRADKATSETAATFHLSWNKDSNKDATIYYANYAEGGAMGASDRSSTGLGTFREQFDRYANDLKSFGPAPGASLYLVWFGLNDLVTNNRSPDDMKKVAVEISAVCQAILRLDPQAHFLFGNLPDPQDAVRYLGKEATDKVIGYAKGSFEFGHELAKELNAQIAAHFAPDTSSGKSETRAAVVDIFTPMYHVCRNLADYGFNKGAQPHGVAVRFNNAPRDNKTAFFTTTSDEAHPTEEVYRLLAQIWGDEISKHFDLGAFRKNAETFVVKGKK